MTRGEGIGRGGAAGVGGRWSRWKGGGEGCLVATSEASVGGMDLSVDSRSIARCQEIPARRSVNR